MLRNTVEGSSFSGLEVGDFVAESGPAKGYIYIVRDTAFPDHIKIGKTINMQKRLSTYNTDKPFPTTQIHAISRVFSDIATVENKILDYLYKQTPPTTFRKEWFELKHLALCERVVEEAESFFD